MTGVPVAVTSADADAGTERNPHWVRAVLHRPMAVVSLVVVVLIVLACVFAGWVAPDNPMAQDLRHIYSGPSSRHWLGTDALGRDELSRILFGGRVTLLGTLEAIVAYLALGVSLGLTAGSFGGVADAFIMRLSDLIQSIPALITLLVVLAVFGHNETAAMVSFGIFASAGLMKVVRSASAAARAEPYVAAARVAGLGPWTILWRHIRPAVVGPVLTQTSLFAGIAMLVEASLGFLDLGVLPPQPSWGNLVSDAEQAINRQQWLLVPSGGIVAVMCLCLTLLGIALRDAYSNKSSSTVRALDSWRSFTAQVHQTQSAGLTVATADTVEPALLSVVNLCVDLPSGDGLVRVVDGVSFDIGVGETVGLVGESGCGKSITVASLLRVPPPGAIVSADRLTLGGRNLLALSEAEMHTVRGRRIAYISQEPVSSLDPLQPAGRQVAEAVRVHRKVGRAEARAIARDLLTSVRLNDVDAVARKYPHELSGGMAQRVAIARALAGDPELLIADEPTTALDVSVQAGILDLLVDLRDRSGMSLVLVTHDWGVLADVCDRALVMYAGQVVEGAPTGSLIATPRHPYSAALLESIPANVTPGAVLPMIRGVVPPPGQWPESCRFAARCRYADVDCDRAAVPPLTTDIGWSRCIHVDRLKAQESSDALANTSGQ